MVSLSAAVALGCGPSPTDPERADAALAGKDCTAPAITVSPPSGRLSVTIAASSTCATGPAEYQFLARAPGAPAYATLRAYGPAATIQWDTSPLVSGRHVVVVYARPQGSTAAYDAAASASYLREDVCSAASLARNEQGATVTLTASARCTGTATPEFRYAVRPPGATTFTEVAPYGAPSPIQLGKPSLPGRHEYIVYVRARGNVSDYESYATASILAGATCSAATIAASGVASSPGAPIVVTATATCSPSVAPEFRFLVRRPGATAFAEIRPYAAGGELQYFPDAPGRHELLVRARAQGNPSDWEAGATTSALAAPSCTVADLVATPAAGAAVVDLAARATCAATPELRFAVRRPGATTFAEARTWGPDPTLAYAWDAPGRWEYQVYARAAGNASDWEATARATASVGPTCGSTILTARLDEPYGPFRVEASPVCTGGAIPEYRFLARAPGAAAFAEIAPWAPTPALSFPVQGPGRYEFQVQVRASGNASEWESTATVAASASPTCPAATLRATWDQGPSVQLLADASCTLSAYPEYRFLVRPPGSLTWTELRPYTYDPIFSFAIDPSASGRYEFRAQVRAAGNASEQESVAVASALVGASCSSARLEASPLVSGGFEIFAQAACAFGTPEYRFLLRRPGSATFVEARAWGGDPLLQLPAETGYGRYEFQVLVRSLGNPSDYETTARATGFLGPTCASATLAGAYDGAGAVALEAGATCAGAAEYRFFVRRPGSPALEEVRAYGADALLSFPAVPAAAGRYEFQVWARAAGNLSDWEATAKTVVTVGPVCGSVTLAATAYGSSLEAAAAATCTGGGAAEYRFLVRSPGSPGFVEARSWSPDPRAYLSAREAGRFEVTVEARAMGNDSYSESTAKASALVGPTCSSATLAAASDGGSGVTLTATAAGCPSPEYQFLVRAPGGAAFAELRAWAPAPSLAFSAPPSQSGRYEFLVNVRYAGNASDWEASARTAVLLGASCSSAGLTATAAPPGRTVDVAATSTCTSATPEYRFLVRRPGSLAYAELRAWGPEAKISLQAEPGASGRYDFRVYVRAAGNASEWEAAASATALVGPSCPSAALGSMPEGSAGVRLAATSVCPELNPEYQFLLRRPGAAAFTELRTWGADPNLSFVAEPGAAGRYVFQVNVRAAGNASDAEASATAARLLGPGCDRLSLAATQPDPFRVDVQSTWTCTGTSPEFRFLVRRPGSTAFEERAWDGNPSFTVVAAPGSYGPHEIRAYVRGYGNRSDYEAVASTVAYLGPSCPSATLGAVVDGYSAQLTAGAACVEGGAAEYRFMIRRPGAAAFAELRGWGPDPRVMFWPESSQSLGRYEFQVLVRAAGNASEYDSTAQATASIGDTCSAVSLAAYPGGNPASVELRATASTCSYGQPEYRFLVRRPGSAAFTELRGWSPEWRLPFSAIYPQVGRHEFMVYARRAGNASDYEASAKLSRVLSFDGCSAATLAATPASGLQVNLLASAACIGWPEYRFFVRRPGAAEFSELATWTTSSVAFFAPVPGRYEFRVHVRASGNASDWEVIAEAAALAGPTCGSPTLTATSYPDPMVALAATSLCGGDWTYLPPSPEYRFMVRPPGAAAFSELRAWAPSPDAQLWPDPAAPGKYELRVDVRASGNPGEPEGSAQAFAWVGRACSSATLTASYGGRSAIAADATASCGGAAAEYRFLVQRPGTTALAEARGWGAGASFSVPIDPMLSGLYQLRVDVRAAGNASASEAYATAAARVGPSCASVALTASAAGSTVNLSAVGSCGSSPVEYRFFARPPGAATYTELRPYGPEGTHAFEAPPGASGAYSLVVHARVAGNASDWEAAAGRLLLVGAACGAVTLTTNADSPGFVRLDAAATCTAAATPEVQFLVQAPGQTAYTPLGAYGLASRFWWQVPAGARGTYAFQVRARASGNASAWESQATASGVLP